MTMSVLMCGGPDLLSLQVPRWIRTMRHVTWSAPGIWDGASRTGPLPLPISPQPLGRGFIRVSPVQGAGIPEPPPHPPPSGSTQGDKEGELAQPLPRLSSPPPCHPQGTPTLSPGTASCALVSRSNQNWGRGDSFSLIPSLPGLLPQGPEQP